MAGPPLFARILSRLFTTEEINGGDRCPTYLYRWHLLKCRWFQVYLHRFVGDDWSRDLHDHPKRFVSVGLKGSYTEWTPGGKARVYRAPWLRSFPATHIHRLTLTDFGRPCWTLVIVFAASRPWGFWTRAGWVPWRRYVTGVEGDADGMKSCPD